MSKTNNSNNLNHIFSNTCGVIIAEFLTLPICTLKTVYQTQLDKNMSIKNTAIDIYKKRGIKGFYSATYSGILSQTLSTVSKYGFYQIIKNYRNTKSDDLFNNSVNGAIGGILGSLISHPIDVYKNYRQRLDSNYLNHLKRNTIATMYKGYSQTIIKNIVLYSSLYPIYDFYKSKFDNPWISSPLTTLTITLYLQPLDYIKVNMMAGNQILIKNSYKGTTLHLARSIPHFMITMSLTEFIYSKKLM